MPRPVVMSYSGGKDCTYALHVLRQDPDWQVVRLLTTATRDHRRTSMHGVRIELLKRQAASLGLPLDIVWLDADGRDYESRMAEMLAGYRRRGIEWVAFGDLYLPLDFSPDCFHNPGPLRTIPLNTGLTHPLLLNSLASSQGRKTGNTLWACIAPVWSNPSKI